MAQDGRQILQGILGGVINGAQQQQQQRVMQKSWQAFERYWAACDNHDVAACDSAFQYAPSDADRRILQKLRDKAVRWPQFAADWRECQPPNPTLDACETALQFPHLTNENRTQLVVWRDQALEERRRVRDDAERRAEQAKAEQTQLEQVRAEQERVERDRADQQAREVELAQQRRIEEARARQQRAVAAIEKQPAALPTIAEMSLLSNSPFSIFNMLLVVVGGAGLMGGVLYGRASVVKLVHIFRDQSRSRLAVDPSAAAATTPTRAAVFLPLTGHFPTDVRNALAT